MSESTQENRHPFSSDHPIQRGDEDKLGRRPFAQSIASAIQNWREKESLVVALCGTWGSGKSSIKNMVIEALAVHSFRRMQVVEFNPWQSANRSQLTEIFFDQVGVALGRGDIGSKQEQRTLLNRWRRYAAYLGTSASFLRNARMAQKVLWLLIAGFGTGVVGLAMTGWSTFLVIVGVVLALLAFVLHLSSGFASWVADVLAIGVDIGRQSLDEAKQELRTALLDLKTPVLIVLDDIDRLTPTETLELLQLVKANGDFPSVIYLALFDRMTVESNIDLALGKGGREYLEKIVQVTFDVPAIERPRLEKVLFDRLDRLLGVEQVGKHFDHKRWGNLFLGGLRPFFVNVRHVNRFLSTLAVHVSMFKPNEVFEVNPVDLIGLEVLRVFEPDVYQALPTNKDALTSQREHAWPGNGKNEKSILETLIEKTSQDKKEPMREILTQLFPAVAGSHGAGSREEWMRELRVCSPDVFDRYFHYAIPQGDISHAAVTRILSHAGNRKALVVEFQKLAEQSLLSVMLDRLEAYMQEIPLDHALPFITAIFDIGEQIPEVSEGMFDISPEMHAVRLVHFYLKLEIDPEKRVAVLRQSMADTDGISLPCRFVAMHEKEKEKESPKELFLSGEGLSDLKKICLGRIVDAAATSKLSSAHELALVLYRWRDWGGEAPVKEYCEKLIQTPSGAIRLLTAMLQRSTSHGMGDFVSEEHWFIRLSAIEKFVSWEKVEDTLALTDLANINAQEKRAVDAFRKAVSRRQEGKPDSDSWVHDD